ncbi:hypothetical protein HDU93_000263 [Gonapodya sp. JEL0774]|nr:hypothetical protein HDU93_000263 [Gonapodya sp. JEL0774]
MTRITNMGHKRKHLPATGWVVNEGSNTAGDSKNLTVPSVEPAVRATATMEYPAVSVEKRKRDYGMENGIQQTPAVDGKPAMERGEGGAEQPVVKKARQRFNKGKKNDVLHDQRDVESRANAGGTGANSSNHAQAPSVNSTTADGPKKKRAYGAVTLEKRRLHRLELKRRTKLKQTICFSCRQKGHSSADCPQKLDTDLPVGTSDLPVTDASTIFEDPTALAARVAAAPRTGLCYRCGSTAHLLSRCTSRPDPDNPLPFASCYICNARGHLSGQCEKNERGMYPNGGGCKWCGSVRHLAKDCEEKQGGKGNVQERREDEVDQVQEGQGGDDEGVSIVSRRTSEKQLPSTQTKAPRKESSNPVTGANTAAVGVPAPNVVPMQKGGKPKKVVKF